MSELGAKANELGGIQKQKDALAKWIETTENNVAEFLTRPSKFRPDAAQMEINMITDIQQTLLEKQAALEDIALREEVQDYDLKIALETLEGHISMLLDKRYSQQGWKLMSCSHVKSRVNLLSLLLIGCSLLCS